MTPMKAFGVTSVLVGMPIRHATCTVTRKRLWTIGAGSLKAPGLAPPMPGGNYSGLPSSYYYAIVAANAQWEFQRANRSHNYATRCWNFTTSPPCLLPLPGFGSICASR